MILVIILYLLFASAFTLGKAALAYVSPFLFIGIRMTVGGALLLAYLFLSKKRVTFEKKDSRLFLQIIFFHIFLSYTLEFWGMEQVNSAKVCLLYNLSPFITALFSYFLFAERLTMRQVCGLIIGFAGFLPILIAQTPTEEMFWNIAFFSVYEIAISISVISSAYGWVTMKNLVHRGYSFIFVNGIRMLGGGILSLVLSLIKEGWPIMKQQPDIVLNGFCSPFMMLSFYTMALIIIANIICYNLYGYLLSRYSPTFLSFSGFMTPLFGAFLGWFFLGEVITWHYFATVGFVFFGLYLFYRNQL